MGSDNRLCITSTFLDKTFLWVTSQWKWEKHKCQLCFVVKQPCKILHYSGTCVSKLTIPTFYLPILVNE